MHEVITLQDNNSKPNSNPEFIAAAEQASAADETPPVQEPTARPSSVQTVLAAMLQSILSMLRRKGATPAELTGVEKAIVALQEEGSAWRGRSLVSLWDVTPEQIQNVLDTAHGMKILHRHRIPGLQWRTPRTLAMLFEKPSLRTRVSFEAGMTQLGGHAIYLAPGDVGLGTRETVPDVAAALSRWVDVVSARVFAHQTVEELAAHATIPVINALSDREHPVQAFADLLTIQEHKGALGSHLKLAYLGDGNNVLHALLLACAKLGIHLTAACPDGYTPDAVYLNEAQRIAQESGKESGKESGAGAQIAVVTDPAEAVQNADVLYTDVWASMGQEDERQVRAQVFTPYQINANLVRQAKPDAIVLHCLPAHRDEEISSEMMEVHKNVILDQAENRLHTQKALLALMLGL